MYRGTTPVHIFNVDTDLSDCKVWITYVQRNKVILDKSNNELTIDSDKITCKLSQDDTLKFNAADKVQVQIRYLTKDNEANVSNIMTMTVKDILKNGVISW